MFEQPNQVLHAVTSGFNNLRVLVVGDLILDRYLWGDVTRISPESPVPVVQLIRENEVGGGAANVAINLSTLGLSVSVVGYAGNDSYRERLLDILKHHDINYEGIVTRSDVMTITKTRIIGGRQQMLRIDREDVLTAVTVQEEEILIKQVLKLLQNNPHAVILSDYNKGVLSHDVCQKIISTCRKEKIPVFVDPKGKSFQKYKGATALSPNRQELLSVCQISSNALDDLLSAGAQLSRELDLDFIAVTLGKDGIALIEEKGIQRLPALAKEVFDVSGAGDTVIAAMCAGLSAGLSRVDSLHLANAAAEVVVGKVGTTAVTKSELLKALSKEQALLQSEKICPLNELRSRIIQWKAKGERIVFTNGCFDLLHAGHVTYLAEAKRLGNRLVVGLNTDRSVRALKGPDRPVIKEMDRARVLAALAAVDAVVLFDEDTPLTLIRAIRPDVLAKGSDYTVEQVVGSEDVKSWQGEVALIQLVDGKSSTQIFQSIQSVSNSNLKSSH